LRVRHADLAARTLRIETSKNDEPRYAVMPHQLFDLVAQCTKGKAPNDPLFTRGNDLVKDFRGSWAQATSEAGVPGLMFHDLRRTAARNMDRRGISRAVIMKIMGHKTQSMFDRYRIGDHVDLADAARRMDLPLARFTSDVQPSRESSVKY
jgi:integrase